MDGWIKSWRKLLDSRVFKNAELLKVWIWCLHKASHKQRWVSIKTGRGHTEVEIKPGQFIFGRFKASEELHMKPSSVRDRMRKLADLSNLTIQPDTHWSIVTICNWDRYQNDESDPRQATRHPTDTQPTPNRHPTDTDKKEENVKKEKKEKKTSPAKPRRDQPIADAFTQAFNARFTEPYIVTRADMSQLNKLLGKRDSLTPERFVEVVTRHWDRGQFRPNASMSIKGACCAWSTLAAWQGNGQSGRKSGGEHMTEIELNRMYAKFMDEQPEPVETPEEMADRLEFKRNYPLRRDIG